MFSTDIVALCGAMSWVSATIAHAHMDKQLWAAVYQFAVLYFRSMVLCRVMVFTWGNTTNLMFFCLCLVSVQVFGDIYHFRHHRVEKRSLSNHQDFHERLESEVQVRGLEIEWDQGSKLTPPNR